MSSIATRLGALKGGFAARIDSLTVLSGTAEVGADRRALMLTIGGPVLVSAFAWMLLPAVAGIAMAIAFTCLSSCAALAAALTLSVARLSRLAVLTIVAVIGAQLALLLAVAGGLESPFAALLVALPIEAWLATRRRGVVGWAAAVAILSALASTHLSAALPAVGMPSAWHWLFPAAYAASLFLRVAAPSAATVDRRPEPEGVPVEEFDGLAVSLAANGDVLGASDRAEAMLGVGADLLSGTGLFERIHVADRVSYLCALADMREGAAARSVELRLRAVSPELPGHASRFRHFKLTLRRADGGAAAFRGLLRDHSEVANLRAALAAAEETARGMDIAKGNFLASVSHELRTPLNSIIGFSDMLMCEVLGSFANEQQRENVGIIRDAGMHLLGVVNSILDVSKIESGSYSINPEPFRFDEAVALCCRLMRLQAQAKQIELKPAIPFALGEVKADSRAVQQILINLVSNAIKFTPAGGAVAIGASKIGTRLHFWVSDTGIGISEHDLGRIGQPFAQVQNDYTRQYDGVGLGLVLVKGLVTLHEGTLAIDSAPGAGTTVTVTLPVEGPRSVDTMRKDGWTHSEAGTDGAFRKAG